MIFPDASREFSPQKLLNRDEFVGIAMEVICERCIQPHTQYRFIEEYVNQDVYFDISPENRYFYCVAEGTAKDYVRGYDVGHACENWTIEFWERPFCPLNTITLEEAIAVLLRNSGLFTIEDNNEVIAQIYNWEITQTLGNDVAPTDADGNPYTFYGYFQKALDYKIIEYDPQGNKKTLSLLEPDVQGNISPKKQITKEEFLRMSYIALKSNSCQEVENNGLALNMLIWEKSCYDGAQNCTLSDLKDRDNTYDFEPEVVGLCDLGIDETYWYMWRFYNITTGENVTKFWRYINDYTFLSWWEWRVYLRVTDACGNSSEVYSTIFVWDENNWDENNWDENDWDENNWDENNWDENDWDENNWDEGISVSIIANPIYGPEDLLVTFEGVIDGDNGPYSYTWDLGDGEDDIGKNIEHLYDEDGIMNVTLTVEDSIGNTGSATIVILVVENDVCEQDSDEDGILDCDDVCPTLPGDTQNTGCPIYETACDNNCGCPDGYTCSDDTPETCWTWVCVPIIINTDTCNYDASWVSIFWNAVCLSCPCKAQFDFLADMRKCDIIFPAITSPDAKHIYSQGRPWQVP